jgi:hypothetical protein
MQTNWNGCTWLSRWRLALIFAAGCRCSSLALVDKAALTSAANPFYLGTGRTLGRVMHRALHPGFWLT